MEKPKGQIIGSYEAWTGQRSPEQREAFVRSEWCEGHFDKLGVRIMPAFRMLELARTELIHKGSRWDTERLALPTKVTAHINFPLLEGKTFQYLLECPGYDYESDNPRLARLIIKKENQLTQNRIEMEIGFFKREQFGEKEEKPSSLPPLTAGEEEILEVIPQGKPILFIDGLVNPQDCQAEGVHIVGKDDFEEFGYQGQRTYLFRNERTLEGVAQTTLYHYYQKNPDRRGFIPIFRRIEAEYSNHQPFIGEIIHYRIKEFTSSGDKNEGHITAEVVTQNGAVIARYQLKDIRLINQALFKRITNS